MADPRHPTAPVTEMFDPRVRKPPTGGENLLCINPGGVLIIGPWRPGYLCWGYKPRMPASVRGWDGKS